MKKQLALRPLIASILTFLLIIPSFYTHATNDDISVTNYSELLEAVNNASTNGTETIIKVEQSITDFPTSGTAGAIIVSSGKKVTIIGDDNVSLSIPVMKGLYTNGGILTLKNIQISVSKSSGIFCGGGSTSLENVTVSSTVTNPIVIQGSASTDICEVFLRGTTSVSFANDVTKGNLINAAGSNTKGTVNLKIEGGTFDATKGRSVIIANITSEFNNISIEPSNYIKLTGPIWKTANAEYATGEGNLSISKIDGYNITSVKLNSEPVSADTNGTYQIDISEINSGIEVNVTANGSNSLTEIPAEDIADSTGGAATVTSSIEDGTATLNVACDQACVVVGLKDGVYTRLTYDGTSSHTFTTDSYEDGMTFVVAVKGDVDCSGSITPSDWGSLIEAYNGSDLSDLSAIIGDVDGSGGITPSDWGSLIEAYNGSSLAWN